MPTQKEKYELVETSRKPGKCFLGKHPASITGALRDYPLVRTLEYKENFGVPVLCVEYSWKAVKRILSKDGKFKS